MRYSAISRQRVASTSAAGPSSLLLSLVSRTPNQAKNTNATSNPITAMLLTVRPPNLPVNPGPALR